MPPGSLKPHTSVDGDTGARGDVGSHSLRLLLPTGRCGSALTAAWERGRVNTWLHRCQRRCRHIWERQGTARILSNSLRPGSRACLFSGTLVLLEFLTFN